MPEAIVVPAQKIADKLDRFIKSKKVVLYHRFLSAAARAGHCRVVVLASTEAKTGLRCTSLLELEVLPCAKGFIVLVQSENSNLTVTYLRPSEN